MGSLKDPRMLSLLVVAFLLFLSPGFTQQSASNTNQLNNQVANLQAQANNVQAGIRSLQRSTNVNQARANEVGAVADYVLSSGTKCGPQTVTGWTERLDYFRDVKVVSTTKQFILEPEFSPPNTWDITKSALTLDFNLEAMQ